MVTQPEAFAWESSLSAARARAAQEGKAVLLDFSAAPHCEASVLMDAETFPDPRVVGFVRSHFVPVKIQVQKEPAGATRHGVLWTPAVLFLDEEAVEQYRAEGYFAPHDFLARL